MIIGPPPKFHGTWDNLHYAANLMSETPKSMWPAVKAMLHSVYDQPDATAVTAQFDRLLDYVDAKLPDIHDHLDTGRADILAFTGFPTEVGTRSGPTTPPNDSTARSGAAPTPSGSSPTATPSSASSAPSWPNKPTNGAKAAATSDSTSSPAAASTSSPPPNIRSEPTTCQHSPPNPHRRIKQRYTTSRDLTADENPPLAGWGSRP